MGTILKAVSGRGELASVAWVLGRSWDGDHSFPCWVRRRAQCHPCEFPGCSLVATVSWFMVPAKCQGAPWARGGVSELMQGYMQHIYPLLLQMLMLMKLLEMGACLPRTNLPLH